MILEDDPYFLRKRPIDDEIKETYFRIPYEYIGNTLHYNAKYRTFFGKMRDFHFTGGLVDVHGQHEAIQFKRLNASDYKYDEIAEYLLHDIEERGYNREDFIGILTQCWWWQSIPSNNMAVVYFMVFYE